MEFLAQMGVSLALDARQAADVAPGATLKLTLSYGNQRPTSESSKEMLGVVKRIVSGGGLGKANRAEATVVREVEAARKGKTKLESDTIDLLEAHLAKKFPVYLGGAGVSIDATILGLMGVIQNNRAEVVRTWERNETETD